MAATTAVEEGGSTSKALKCQTWVLKVSIHCQGCKRKVKKVLLGIDGVYTATIDLQQQRVTVTGNIEAEKLIKRLIKTGKHAEIWPETSPSENKEPGKPKNTHKQNNTTNNEAKNTAKITQQTPNAATSAETTAVSEESPELNNNAGENGGSGKKKKRKGQKRENTNSNSNSTINSPSSGKAEETGFQSDGMGTNQSNLSPTRKQSVPLPYPQQQGYNIPPAYASTYSYRMAYPREYSYPGNYLNVPAVSPYPKGNPPDSFFYFSDENVHGCSIM